MTCAITQSDTFFAPSRDRPRADWRFVGLLLAAVVLRIPGLFTDFWLDEIWSHGIAMNLHRGIDALVGKAAHIDNNHPLNTWLMNLIGPTPHWWIYRLPALLAGIGSALLAWRIGRRFGRIEALIAMSLIGCGFPFVFYSTEARGYSLAVFFALLAFAALLQDLDRPSVRWAVLFNLSCVLGMLSHLTFIHVYLAAIFWSLLRIRKSTRGIPTQLARWLRLHALPLTCFVSIYQVFVKGLLIGGAAPTDPADTLIASMSLSFSGPTFGIMALISTGLVMALFIASLVQLIRQHNDLWVLFAIAVCIAPGFLLLYDLVLSVRPQPLMPRYFLVSMTIIAIAISHPLAAMWRANGVRRTACLAGAILFIIGNARHLTNFARTGRAGHTAAIARMLSIDDRPTITVAGDSAFRVGRILEFYHFLVPPNRSIEFHDRIDDKVNWLITTKPIDVPTNFTLDSIYPASELSGTEWRLYHHNSK